MITDNHSLVYVTVETKGMYDYTRTVSNVDTFIRIKLTLLPLQSLDAITSLIY